MSKNNNQTKMNVVEKDEENWSILLNTREKVIQTIAKNMDLFGVTPSVGRLYGTLFFNDEPLTLDGMVDELEMSKTSMSTGVRSLMEIHMVHKTWQKGVRKDLYEAEEDWYKSFIDLFTTKWRKAIEMNSQIVKKSNKDLQQLINNTSDEQLKAAIQKDIEKLNHAIGYYDWLLRLVECFESEQIYTLVPKSKD